MRIFKLLVHKFGKWYIQEICGREWGLKPQKVDLRVDKVLNQYVKDTYSARATDRTSVYVEDIAELPASYIVKARLVNVYQEKSVYIKLMGLEDISTHRKLISNEYNILNRLYNRTKNNPEFTVIKPLAVNYELLALITEESKGERFDKLFKNRARFLSNKSYKELEKYCGLCGKWLSFMQKETKLNKHNVSVYSNLRKGIIDNLRKIQEISPPSFYYKLFSTITEYLKREEKSHNNGNQVVSWYHGDFRLGNILIDGNRIVILDFTDSGIGSIYMDLATFHLNLEMLKYSFSILDRNKIRELQMNFVDSFNTSNDATFDIGLFKLSYLNVLLKSILESIRLLRTYKRNRLKIIDTYYCKYQIKKMENIIERICFEDSNEGVTRLCGRV